MAHKPSSAVLSGDGTIFGIAAHHRALTEALRGEGPIMVDLSGLGQTDIAFVQLLVAAERTAASAGRSLTFSNAPDTLHATCARAGVTLAADLPPQRVEV